MAYMDAVKNKLTWSFAFRILFFLLLIAAIAAACASLPVERILKNFLIWVKQDLGPWGPIALTLAYIPLTVLAVPASVLSLGGGYLFGLTVGFIADSVGATLGATAAFLIGRSFGKSCVIYHLGNYPNFHAVAMAIQRSGFKITLLLRLVPFLPFNITNYLLAVTPVMLGEYVLASWLGMLPITFALVYMGTMLKDLSDVTHGWNEISIAHWVYLLLGSGISVILMVWITRIAKASLEKAIEESKDIQRILAPSMLPIMSDDDWQEHLVINVEPSKEDQEDHEKETEKDPE